MVSVKSVYRNFIPVLAAFILLHSCTTDGEDQALFPDTYVLISMEMPLTGEVITGKNMEWQERIELNADGSFTKFTVQEGEAVIGEGIYTITGDFGAELLTLNYTSEDPFIINCGRLREETYTFDRDLIRNTAIACDAPLLTYRLRP